MGEWSVFIDEGGDSGPYAFRSPYYSIAMVFRDKSVDISGPIYYDHGQTGITRIPASVCTVLLPETEIRRVTPSGCRLFRAADLFCSVELIRLKPEASAIAAPGTGILREHPRFEGELPESIEEI